MDIQGYIIDHWMEKMSAEKPVLVIYDREGFYHSILPLAEKRGVKVIDTTKGLLHARLAASRFWCDELSQEKDLRLIIYRQKAQPTTSRQWVEEPYSAFKNAAAMFPVGPQDDYKYICQSFLPNKIEEINQLFESGNTSFNMVNALLDGAAYPALEELTGGKSFVEMTIGLLVQTACSDMGWLQEWTRFAGIQYPELDSTGVTLQEIQQKLWMYLLFSEFVFDLPGKLPDSLQTVAMAPAAMKDKIYMVCDQLRTRTNLREVYVRMARKTADAYHLAELFAKAKHLGDRVTFAFENSVEYERYVAYLKEGKLADAHAMLKKNKEDVWYQEDAEVAVFWKLAGYALQIADCMNRGIKADGNVKDLVEWYAGSGQEADYAFRKYLTDSQDAVNLPDAVKALTEYVNGVYAEFTERGVKEYQQRANEIREHVDLKNQVCMDIVYPALSEGKRVALFFVDAFRYEMGKSFADSISRNYPEHVQIQPKLAFLPSVTRFGMANHLGHVKIVEREGKAEPSIDGKLIISPDDRIEYLREKANVEVQDVRLENLQETSIEDHVRLLIVRSQSIDSEGENNKLEGLASMDKVLVRLARAINVCKQNHFDMAVLVADHGFMLQPAFRMGNLAEKPIGSDIILEESRMLMGNLNDSKDALSFTPAELGIDAEAMKVCYAKNFTVFRKGDVYYHEGLSLQENVVPQIVVQLQEERQRQSFKVDLKYKGNAGGTVYTRRPLIDIHIHQDDLFADAVVLRMTIKDKNGSVIGQPCEKFYDDVTQTLHIPSGVTQARQTICIDEEYEGDNIVVSVLNAETNVSLSTLCLNFENDL